MGNKPSKGITIIFIINGVDVPVTAAADDPLQEVRDEALLISSNTGRPFSDWVTRDEAGVTLPPEQLIERFNFTDEVRLFLMPMVGVGGDY